MVIQLSIDKHIAPRHGVPLRALARLKVRRVHSTTAELPGAQPLCASTRVFAPRALVLPQPTRNMASSSRVELKVLVLVELIKPCHTPFRLVDWHPGTRFICSVVAGLSSQPFLRRRVGE